MKSNKGFTLVEVLGVLVVLGIIGMIVVPTVQTTITKNKQRLYKEQVEGLINATSKFIVDYDTRLATFGDDEACSIVLTEFISMGYLKNNDGIKDPITGNSLNGEIYIKWSTGTNQYEYKYKNNDDEHRDKDYASGSNFYSNSDNWTITGSCNESI